MRHVQARNPITNAPVSVRPQGITDVLPASVAERRVMKKVAQPEHAYTGCVPQREEPETAPLPVKRNPPILGYKGHLRNAEDRIGTTFTNGLAIATRAAEPTRGLRIRYHTNQRQQDQDKREERLTHKVRFQQPPSSPPKKQHSPPRGHLASPPRRGNLKSPPKQQMSPRSKYGAFDNTSGYGEFQAPPPMSKRSGYGAFDNASSYGEFAAPPPMSKRSGYGEFDDASGYGEFAAPPQPMSKRSGYGEFDGASGYGEFAAPPPAMSKRSGYGEFDDASGYGEFAAPPPSDNQSLSPQPPMRTKTRSSPQVLQLKYSETLDKRYEQALKSVGGRANALKLWHAAASTISCRYRKRTELLQAIKRSFEKREAENRGHMTREQLKEALQSLACVFTDDQVTALFGLYDTHCRGTVPMDTFLLALTDCL